MSHYKGEKRAQNLRRYVQMHGEKDERQEPGKQIKLALVWFQMDESGVEDKNKCCDVCGMFFTSPAVALSHYLGKVHRKKLKQLSGDQAHMAAQSMQPLSALQMPLAEKPLLPSEAAESSSSSDTKLNLNDPEKYCKLCCAPFNNPLMAWEHYVGKRHRKNEARQKVLKKLGDSAVPAEFVTSGSFFSAVGAGYCVCSVCNIVLTSVQMYHSHMMGNKHQIK
ncbi:PREDICTED: zinc finger matrin-type protein 1-like [Apaloderma vittatum]|uniref:zinc finger matrin-type protein 1-like n=1 Tax=Apaloderma vittatum TaxID=57397 RepID=UPI000521CF2D|nr:PREDICTED: zinc finger matrin-type protein 1-like [Apaloderma vittatum]